MKKHFKKVLVVLLAFMLTFATACKDDKTTQYKVTFDARGGSAVATQTVDEGGKATKPTDPTKSGFTFGGWYTDQACTDGKEYDFTAKVTKSFTLYAKWNDAATPVSCTVTFDSAGGSAVEAQVVDSGSLITKPADPTKTNYMFAGWYFEKEIDGLVEEVLWDFEADTVEGTMTLVAHWTQTHYSVTFETGTDATVESQSVEKDGKATAPAALTKEGFTFVGWYTSAAYVTKWDFDSVVDKDLKLYARWYESKTVDGDLSDWSAAELEHFVVCRAQNNAKETRGWTLYGKYVKDAGLYLAGYMDHNTVRDTKPSDGNWWQQTNIEFKINGSDQLYVNTNGQTSIPEGADKIIITKEKATEGNENFPNTYRSFWEVFFPENLIPNNNGGPQRIGFAAATNNDNIAVGNRGAQVWWCNEGKDPNNSAKGYFVYDDAFGMNDEINSRGIFVNENRAPVTGSITFNSNGGSPVTPMSVQIGQKVTKPADPTRVDYTFDGWYKDSALTTAWNFDTDVVMQSYPLYAKWNPAAQYTVTFNANGADSGEPAPMTDIWVGSKIEEPAAPVKSGFIFMGWYEDNTTFEILWAFESSTVTGDITLYAKWVAVQTFNITFNSNGGSEVTAATAQTGQLVTKPADPTKAGYTFMGWFKDEALATAWDFAADKVDADLTLYAKWYKTPDADLTEWFGEGDVALYQGQQLRDAVDGKRGVDLYAHVAPEGLYIAVVIYHDNATVSNAGEWHKNTNAEFWINGGTQYWANSKGEKSGNVTAAKYKTETGTDTTHKTTFELFIAGSFNGSVRMALATKPDGGVEKLNIAGFTSFEGKDAWWMVAPKTIKAQTDSSVKFGDLGSGDINQQFYVYNDGIHLTEKV